MKGRIQAIASIDLNEAHPIIAGNADLDGWRSQPRSAFQKMRGIFSKLGRC